MKLYFKFSILFFALAMLFISSCKEEVIIIDDVDPVEENRLLMIGTWSATNFSQANCTDETSNFNFSPSANGTCWEAALLTETCIVSNIIFSANSNITGSIVATTTLAGSVVDETTIPLTGTWEILDETRMTVCLPNLDGIQECSTGTYTITDTTLTYSGNNTNSGCDVNLTATKQ